MTETPVRSLSCFPKIRTCEQRFKPRELEKKQFLKFCIAMEWFLNGLIFRSLEKLRMRRSSVSGRVAALRTTRAGYITKARRSPFHVTGPTLPFDYQSGELFSIFTRSECWTLSELEYLTQVNAKPWSLTLCGPEFSDDLSIELLDLDTIQILELEATSIAGKLLKSIAFMPKLRVLRLAGAEQPQFDLTYLPVNHCSLTSFSFRGLPSSVLGSCLRKSFPKMTELILAGSQRVQWNEPPVLTGLEKLSVSFPDFATWIGSIEGTKSVSFAFDSCSNEQVFEALSTGQATLKYVTLRGTPVDEEVFKVLNDMPRLKHIDVVDAKVSRKALQEFIAKRPELTCWPKLI